MALTLASLHVYPVKGLKGIDLEASLATPRGLEHDRRWMVVDAESQFISQREHPKMATIWTEFVDGTLELSAPDMPAVDVPLAPDTAPSLRVRVWKSEVDAAPVSSFADAWLSEYLGFPCRLVYMPDESRRESPAQFGGEGNLVGFADAFAWLVAGEASLGDLNTRLKARGHTSVPMNRFRPNLVVAGAEPYAEDGWRDIRVGEAILRGVKECARCQVPTTDQMTGEVRGPEPIATLSTYRQQADGTVLFGMNFVTVRGGTMRVGDTVEILA
jgi:uncharacterized protein YcbX